MPAAQIAHARRTNPLLWASASGLSGALVGLPQKWPEWAFLQVLGCAIIFACYRHRPRWVQAMGMAVCFGCVLAATRTPYEGFRAEGIMGLFLLVFFLGWLCAMAAWIVSPLKEVRAAVCWAALVGILDFLQVRFLGIFGTTQTLALPWAAYPTLIAFVAIWGWGAITFFVAGLGALASVIFIGKNRARGAAAALLWALFFWIPGWWYGKSAESGTAIRAVAVGFWEMPIPQKMARHIQRFSRDAQALPLRESALASKSGNAASMAMAPDYLGPTFFVFPEFAFVDPSNAVSIRWIQQIAQGLPPDSLAAVGWFDNETHYNQCSLVSPDGEQARYRKTHLLPYIERYHAGDGNAVTAMLGEVTAGVMICQDDNFSDVSRALSRAGAQVVALPVMDWPGVNEIHPLSAVIRAIEGRFAIVRAAACGENRIISPTGKTLARTTAASAKTQNISLIDTHVYVGAGHSWYARFGDSPVCVLFGVCLLGSIIPLKKRRRTG